MSRKPSWYDGYWYTNVPGCDKKYLPVAVSFDTFVCTIFPPFSAPFSIIPPPGTGFLCKALAPLRTVKLAKLISFGLRVTTFGIPK